MLPEIAKSFYAGSKMLENHSKDGAMAYAVKPKFKVKKVEHMKSSDLHKAIQLIEEIKGKVLSIEKRKELAIELARLMLEEASKTTTFSERKSQKKLAELMKDPNGKTFTTILTDQCFRSSSHRKTASRIIDLLNDLGTPNYLSLFERFGLTLFKALPPFIAQFLVPFAKYGLRKETKKVILPAEPYLLKRHLEKRRKENVRLNINHLGEAILSEKESQKRLETYLKDLEHPYIDYISVKISTIYSQIHLIDFDQTLEILAERLKTLYRKSKESMVVLPDGTKRARFINLDMEEYRDLDLTVALFQKVLNEEEFFDYSAGIVLQAYLPDSHAIQKRLTEWAKERVAKGGAPIKIRIVKGANLAMEQFEASLRDWPQAPYKTKVEVDANYKRMVAYGSCPENARAVRLGVASHNLFDLAFAMVLRAEHDVERFIGFEMLEGMADPIRRVVQKLTKEVILYCPIAKKKDFQHAIAYLIRRLDENTGEENFLRHAFGLKAGSSSWNFQVELFSKSCDLMEKAFLGQRRKQNRMMAPIHPDFSHPFENEPDTDFSLPQNRVWAQEIAKSWQKRTIDSIPCVIGGTSHFEPLSGEGFSSSLRGKKIYSYVKADKNLIEQAIRSSEKAFHHWKTTTVEHRSHLLASCAKLLRERRGELIGAMMLDAGKTILEADPEVSEAIDFAEYYRKEMEDFSQRKELSFEPKGIVLVASPWNFPCSIPAGGIFAALAAGNSVLFKPASDAILIGFHLVQALWDAGISKEVLQFVPCSGEESGEFLIKDPRVHTVILTGGTETARKLLSLRPDLDLAAETGGKNAIIVTSHADRDLAIKDIIQSAFGHSGQKCSAASLLILEKEVYSDLSFQKALVDAIHSWKVGSSFDLGVKINPLIHEPKGVLKKGLTELCPKEKWLLEPKVDPENPALWSPGIKSNVKPKAFTHMTELFGPVLTILEAKDLKEAIDLANMTPYGLTSGLHSLDPKEQTLWLETIEAGNLYINRTITGAIVKRQPFGGTKASNFGSGSKAGGPNYLRELLNIKEKTIPQEKKAFSSEVAQLIPYLNYLNLSQEELGLWMASAASYAFFKEEFQKKKDLCQIVGQDNFFEYRPRKKMVFRLSPKASPFDVLRTLAAILSVNPTVTLSFDPKEMKANSFAWLEEFSLLNKVEEDHLSFLQRIEEGQIERVRLLEPCPYDVKALMAKHSFYVVDQPVLSNGRFELLHFLREVAISIDYHRYGNLGAREHEKRKPIL